MTKTHREKDSIIIKPKSKVSDVRLHYKWARKPLNSPNSYGLNVHNSHVALKINELFESIFN